MLTKSIFEMDVEIFKGWFINILINYQNYERDQQWMDDDKYTDVLQPVGDSFSS